MTTKQVAELTGVSVRTLHHYDDIGLLVPRRNPENHYREYTQQDLDRLQQILLYRACGFPLSKIQELLDAPDFQALESFLYQQSLLLQEKDRIHRMLQLIEHSVAALKGEKEMTNEEKFQAFKKQQVADNRTRYEEELLSRYGEGTVEAAEQSFLNRSKEEYDQGASLAQEILALLEEGMEKETPDLLQRLGLAHQKWIRLMWGDAVPYSKDAHLGLIDTYLADERFLPYYGGKEQVLLLQKAVQQLP